MSVVSANTLANLRNKSNKLDEDWRKMTAEIEKLEQNRSRTNGELRYARTIFAPLKRIQLGKKITQLNRKIASLKAEVKVSKQRGDAAFRLWKKAARVNRIRRGEPIPGNLFTSSLNNLTKNGKPNPNKALLKNLFPNGKYPPKVAELLGLVNVNAQRQANAARRAKQANNAARQANAAR